MPIGALCRQPRGRECLRKAPLDEPASFAASWSNDERSPSLWIGSIFPSGGSAAVGYGGGGVPIARVGGGGGWVKKIKIKK